MVGMGIRTYGPNAVDWEQRIDVDRLRRDRLARLKATLGRSELGSLLTFDFHNMRYMTSTHIGTWAMDKLIRFALLPRGGEPVAWDFGSAARHHQLYNPWLDGRPDQPELGRARAGISTLRGAFNPDAGIAEEVARKIKRVLDEHGLAGEPLGSEHVEGVNAISGERCAPHPHVYSDRILRPGDPAFFDILHSYNGYRTCY